jgi:hypothetical protein
VNLTLADDSTARRTDALRAGIEVVVFGAKGSLPRTHDVGDIIRLHRVKARVLPTALRAHGVSMRLRVPRAGRETLALRLLPQVDWYNGRPQFVAQLKKQAAFVLFSRTAARARAATVCAMRIFVFALTRRCSLLAAAAGRRRRAIPALLGQLLLPRARRAAAGRAARAGGVHGCAAGARARR